MSEQVSNAASSEVSASGRFSEEARAQLAEIVTHYPEKRAAMLPALWIAQREYGGWLPVAALREVAALLERPLVEVQSVASFYTMFNLQPRGRYHVEVCTCLTCSLFGAYDVLHHLEKRFGVQTDELSKDGEVTVSEAECLNWCEAGPVIQIGDRYFGHVTVDNVDQLIDEVVASGEHTTVAQADAIVGVLMPGNKKSASRGTEAAQSGGEEGARNG